ncbi:MAG: nickel pincer cofactor biosynthesis protein LarC [Candidatus Aminicenantales bacterium]
MRLLHFQPTAGLSGDMILAALLDIGIKPTEFRQAIKDLGLEIKLKIGEVRRASLRARRVEVVLPPKKKMVPRKWREVEAIIKKSRFSPEVKERSLRVFDALFAAEAKVHGETKEKIHLHEAAADDALVDIVGTCWLLEKLAVDKITCSPINLGGGWVKTSHGLFPVPPPAVAELLRNVPVYSAGVEDELTTPTGAAIISTIAPSFITFPEVVVNRVGCGAGGRDFPAFPNILRVFLGEEASYEKEAKVFEIRTNIDDSTSQVLAYAAERLMAEGALDVFLTPIVMKKGRLATQLTVLAQADKIDKIIETIFRETSTIGVRYHPVERKILERREEKVKLAGEEIPVKIASLKGKEIQVQPEYEGCRRLAMKKGLPFRHWQQQAVEAWKRKRRT